MGESIRELIELTRPVNCLLAGLAVLIGGFVSGGSSLQAYLLSFIAAFLITGGGNAINDFFDRDIDRINKPGRPIPSGRVRLKDVLMVSRLLFVAGMVFAAALRSLPCLLLAGFNAAVLVAYPARLKRSGLPGNLTIAYLVGSTFLFGGLAQSASGTWSLAPTFILFLLSFLSTAGREIIKSIQDMVGDRRLGLRTFPIVHGKRKAAVTASALIFSAVCLSPLPSALDIFGPLYAILLVPSLFIFTAAAVEILKSQAKISAGRASLYCKIAMFIGLLAFIGGAATAP